MLLDSLIKDLWFVHPSSIWSCWFQPWTILLTSRNHCAAWHRPLCLFRFPLQICEIIPSSFGRTHCNFYLKLPCSHFIFEWGFGWNLLPFCGGDYRTILLFPGIYLQFLLFFSKDTSDPLQLPFSSCRCVRFLLVFFEFHLRTLAADRSFPAIFPLSRTLMFPVSALILL